MYNDMKSYMIDTNKKVFNHIKYIINSSHDKKNIAKYLYCVYMHNISVISDFSGSTYIPNNTLDESKFKLELVFNEDINCALAGKLVNIVKNGEDFYQPIWAVDNGKFFEIFDGVHRFLATNQLNDTQYMNIRTLMVIINTAILLDTYIEILVPYIIAIRMKKLLSLDNNMDNRLSDFNSDIIIDSVFSAYSLKMANVKIQNPYLLRSTMVAMSKTIDAIYEYQKENGILLIEPHEIIMERR